MNADLLHAYLRVQERRQLPPMSIRRLSVESAYFEAVNDVWIELESIGSAKGWLGFQSGNELLTVPGAVRRHDSFGTLIDAELVGTGRTIQVRYCDERWITTKYTPDAGSEFIVDEIALLMTVGGSLIYERLWDLDEQGGLRQVYARLKAVQSPGSKA